MRLRWHTRVAGPLIAVAIWLALHPAAAAHPLGNFTINRYSRLEPMGESLRITYVLDMAEIPTFQERTAIDSDRDGQISAVERDDYADRKVRELQAGLSLGISGHSGDLRLLSRSLAFPDGQGGLPTLRLEAVFEAPVPARSSHSVDYEDRNYRGRIGWKEIVVRPGPGASVLESDAPATDISDGLRRYPEDMLFDPPNRTKARFRFEGGGSGRARPLASFPTPPVDRLLSVPAPVEMATPSFLLALAAAAAWGSLHALSPGHGKTLVAAYLVGARGTPQHAALLGAVVTATHTLGVYGLGILTIVASQYVVPEKLYPWIGALSGLLVVAIGAALARQRLHQVVAVHPAWQHLTPNRAAELILGGRHRGGARPYDHLHEHGEHGHEHGEHGHGHSHLPSADARSLTPRGLLGLGISGGLLPCPSALVLMLGAIALGQPIIGLVLVLAFSVGLAAVLVGLGLAVVYAHRLLGRIRTEGALTELIPLGSALFILAAGLYITIQSLQQTGVLPGGYP